MPWNSPTAYTLKGSGTKVVQAIGQMGKSRSGKTRSLDQIVKAYGLDSVILVNNGGALDSLLTLDVATENATNYEEVAALLDTMYQNRENLPPILFHDDITRFGDEVEAEASAEFKGMVEGKDKNIKKYHKISVDARRYVTRFNMLPAINIYNLTEGDQGKIMFPGGAFIDHFIRMVGPVITLRAVVDMEDKDNPTVERWYDTRGRSGETGGDRTGVLAPREPPDLPAIIESVFKLKRKYATICEPDGSMTRKEDQ